MEVWIIFSKLSIIAYIIIKAGLDSTRIQAAFILLMLFYICSDMCFYILKNHILKTAFFIGSLLLIAAGAAEINNLFILLLPINVFEAFVIRYKKYLYVSVIICIAPLSFIKSTMLPEYMFVAFMSSLICTICFKNQNKISYLISLSDDLKDKNYNLKGSRNQDLQYENNIRYLSQLEERNKIAQEIHDKIGHTIAGSIMQLEASKLLLNEDKTTALQMLQSTIDNLRAGMDSIRVTLRNIKPPSEQIGVNKIKLILDEFMISSNILAVLYYSGDLEVITIKQWKILQENTKEALTNVIKYSEANKVNVNIEVLNKVIKCEIKDNGVGALNIEKGLGISGFEERIEEAGGKVIIDGSSGFSVIFLLPIEK